MNFIISTVALLIASTHLSAVEIPTGGFEMSASSKLVAYADGKVGKVEKLDPTGYRLSITQPDPTNNFRAQVSIACPQGALAKGDKVLAVITARVSGQESGSLEAKLQLADPPTPTPPVPPASPFPRYGPITRCSSPWKTRSRRQGQHEPLLRKCRTSDRGFSDPRVSLRAGDGCFKIPAHPPILCRTRTRCPMAQGGSRTHRKNQESRLLARSNGPDGKPLANTHVDLTLRRHEFGFGSAVPASLCVADTEDAKRFREIVDRLFSIVVFENDLKDMWWGDSTPSHKRAARNTELNKAFDWLGERRIAIRGHYLMQVATPHNLAKMDNASIRRHFLETTRQRIKFAGDRVCEWDVINHPIAWTGADMLSKRPGSGKTRPRSPRLGAQHHPAAAVRERGPTLPPRPAIRWHMDVSEKTQGRRNQNRRTWQPSPHRRKLSAFARACARRHRSIRSTRAQNNPSPSSTLKQPQTKNWPQITRAICSSPASATRHTPVSCGGDSGRAATGYPPPPHGKRIGPSSNGERSWKNGLASAGAPR